MQTQGRTYRQMVTHMLNHHSSLIKVWQTVRGKPDRYTDTLQVCVILCHTQYLYSFSLFLTFASTLQRAIRWVWFVWPLQRSATTSGWWELCLLHRNAPSVSQYQSVHVNGNNEEEAKPYKQSNNTWIWAAAMIINGQPLWVNVYMVSPLLVDSLTFEFETFETLRFS